MNRTKLKQFIFKKYKTKLEYLWIKNPNYEVYRHKNNKKWFALIMNIPKNKIGLKGDEYIDIVNLKCDRMIIGALRKEKGIYPAYHMNKINWVTLSLDENVSDEKIKMLLDMSYKATELKIKNNNKKKNNEKSI